MLGAAVYLYMHHRLVYYPDEKFASSTKEMETDIQNSISACLEQHIPLMWHEVLLRRENKNQKALLQQVFLPITFFPRPIYTQAVLFGAVALRRRVSDPYSDPNEHQPPMQVS